MCRVTDGPRSIFPEAPTASTQILLASPMRVWERQHSSDTNIPITVDVYTLFMQGDGSGPSHHVMLLLGMQDKLAIRRIVRGEC